jgi:hypothetical protein
LINGIIVMWESKEGQITISGLIGTWLKVRCRSAAFISVWITTKTIGGWGIGNRGTAHGCAALFVSLMLSALSALFGIIGRTHDPPLSTHREALVFTPLSLPPSVGFEQRIQVRRFPQPSHQRSPYERDRGTLLAMSGGNRIYMLRMASREGPFPAEVKRAGKSDPKTIRLEHRQRHSPASVLRRADLTDVGQREQASVQIRFAVVLQVAGCAGESSGTPCNRVVD